MRPSIAYCHAKHHAAVEWKFSSPTVMSTYRCFQQPYSFLSWSTDQNLNSYYHRTRRTWKSRGTTWNRSSKFADRKENILIQNHTISSGCVCDCIILFWICIIQTPCTDGALYQRCDFPVSDEGIFLENVDRCQQRPKAWMDASQQFSSDDWGQQMLLVHVVVLSVLVFSGSFDLKSSNNRYYCDEYVSDLNWWILILRTFHCVRSSWIFRVGKTSNTARTDFFLHSHLSSMAFEINQ